MGEKNTKSNAYIIDSVRTPRGLGKPGKGAISQLHPQELLAQALNELANRTEIKKTDVEDVVIGCVNQVNEQGANIARNTVLAAGWPVEITGVSLNRFCGSGLQAVNFAAMGVMAGMQELVIGGGVENMSRHGIGADGAGIDGGNILLRKKHPQVPQGISADLIATLEGFTREELDRFALQSQKKSAEAQISGRFKKSVIPVYDPESGKLLLERDEHPRPATTLEGLAALKPSFADLGINPFWPNGDSVDRVALSRYPEIGKIHHLHTAGNSSGIVDGAAAVLIASDSYIQRSGLKPRARIRAIATAGSEPIIMLTAPVPASQKALKIAGMSIKEIIKAFEKTQFIKSARKSSLF